MRINDLLSVRIDDLALGGKAVARHEGRVVFVDSGLPGDQLRVRVKRVKRSFAEAQCIEIEHASALHVAASCPHVAQCGGCRLQDMAYPQQCEFKERQVRETLARIGGVIDPNVRPLKPAPEIFHYRNKMEFSFHPDAQGRPLLGLHERGTFDRVFALETCVLPSPLTVEIVKHTQAFASAHGWSAYHSRHHHGVVRFLTVRHLPHTDQCAVHLVAATRDVPGLQDWAREIAALSDAVRTVTFGINDSRANIAFTAEQEHLIGGGLLLERLLGLEFEVSANAFLQTNSKQAEALYSAALEAGRLQGDEVVIDLYCGTGTLTLLFARRARAAIGVESVDDAVVRARRNARRNGVENVEFVSGESRPVLRMWARDKRPGPEGKEIVVVDPPRAGLHPRVVARIAERAPLRVVYVSCNPATLARDVLDFSTRGYGLIEVEPFDMFPHTPHIECVARLEPKEG